MIIIRTQELYHAPFVESNSGEIITVPEQTIDISELLARHEAGLLTDIDRIGDSGTFIPDMDHDSPDVEKVIKDYDFGDQREFMNQSLADQKDISDFANRKFEEEAVKAAADKKAAVGKAAAE
jgi:hypothetical protein